MAKNKYHTQVIIIFLTTERPIANEQKKWSSCSEIF